MRYNNILNQSIKDGKREEIKETTTKHMLGHIQNIVMASFAEKIAENTFKKVKQM